MLPTMVPRRMCAIDLVGKALPTLPNLTAASMLGQLAVSYSDWGSFGRRCGFSGGVGLLAVCNEVWFCVQV